MAEAEGIFGKPALPDPGVTVVTTDVASADRAIARAVVSAGQGKEVKIEWLTK